ncbi:MAG: GNAT family protein [Verrucomicrobiota bacterium]
MLPINDRYFLSEITANDTAAYVMHFSDSTIHENLLLVPSPYTSEDAYWWINHVHSDPLRLQTNRAIRDSSGFLVGAIGVVGKFDPNSHEAEFGYWLSAQARGQGLMTQTIQTFMQYLFETFQVERFIATPFAHNKTSQRVLEKAGFTQEPEARIVLQKNRKNIDAVVYSRIR